MFSFVYNNKRHGFKTPKPKKGWLLCLVISLPFLMSCEDNNNASGLSEPANQSVSNGNYLLPQLKQKTLTSISLSSTEGHTELSVKEGQWWVNSPVDFPADKNVVNAFVQNLIDIEAGKEIKVLAKDFVRLGVDEKSGITVKLTFNNNKTPSTARSLTLVFGNISQGKDADSMMGAGFSARRYIRVIDESKHINAVYLAPISLVDLTSSAGLWTDAEFIRISSFKQLTLTSQGKTKAFHRNHLFGPLLKGSAKNGTKITDPIVKSSMLDDNKQLYCFESFLREGRSHQVGGRANQPNRSATTATATTADKMTSNDVISVRVESFFGVTYQFDFQAAENPSEKEVLREAMQANFLNKGVADVRVPFVLTVNQLGSNTNLTVFEQALKDKNIELAKRFKQRIAYITWQQFQCLQAINLSLPKGDK